MRILLTGATGFLCYRTLEFLAELSVVISIRANGRKIKNTHYFEHPKVTYHLGDLSDSKFVETLANDIDVIIHAAA